jgi:hypothetical protein
MPFANPTGYLQRKRSGAHEGFGQGSGVCERIAEDVGKKIELTGGAQMSVAGESKERRARWACWTGLHGEKEKRKGGGKRWAKEKGQARKGFVFPFFSFLILVSKTENNFKLNEIKQKKSSSSKFYKI